MSTSSQIANIVSAWPVCLSEPQEQWYAIRTRSRHEKTAAQELKRRDIDVFLPLAKSVRQWSDRRQEVEFPLFPGYAFVRIAFSSRQRVSVLEVPGVAGFVGPNPSTLSIPVEQIESIRTLLAREVRVKEHPFLTLGQRVRVRGGALDGVEGILSAVNGTRNLIISVQPIQRSLSVNLSGYEVEAVA